MTAQMRERLIYGGEETSMAFCPPLPYGHPRIVEQTDAEMISGKDSIVFCTACWRRYVGTWQIDDGRFFLIGLDGRYKLVG